MDPAQTLKTQIGELVWSNAVLSGRIAELEKQIEDLRKSKEEEKIPNADV